jgi:hypothetical protein
MRFISVDLPDPEGPVARYSPLDLEVDASRARTVSPIR